MFRLFDVWELCARLGGVGKWGMGVGSGSMIECYEMDR